jgi:hypothetical protein
LTADLTAQLARESSDNGLQPNREGDRNPAGVPWVNVLDHG